MTRQTDLGRSENGSPAIIDASSTTHTPSSGDRCLPRVRRAVLQLMVGMGQPLSVRSARASPASDDAPAVRAPESWTDPTNRWGDDERRVHDLGAHCGRAGVDLVRGVRRRRAASRPRDVAEGRVVAGPAARAAGRPGHLPDRTARRRDGRVPPVRLGRAQRRAAARSAPVLTRRLAPSLRGAVDAHLASRDVARVIYGAIVGLAVVVALEAHPPTSGQTAATVAGTALAVGLAELYGEYVGAEIRTRRPVARSQLRHLAHEAAPVMFGAAFPAVFFLLAAAGAIEPGSAFVLAKWTGAGLICGYGFVAARLSGCSVGRALVHAAALGGLAVALIGLKALLH